MEETSSRSICDQCGNGFSNIYTLSAHKKQVHQGIKSFACSICDTRFATKHKLQRHFLGVHSDKRDFHCPTCSRSFKTRDMLVKHQRVHFDKGPFSCSFCDEIFKFKSGLDHHTKMRHLEREPLLAKDAKKKPAVLYECGSCGKLLKSIKQLERHEISCNNQNEMQACAKCSETFLTQKDLSMHEKKAHQEVSYFSCSYCHKLYKSKSNFVIHIASHEIGDEMKDYEYVVDPVIEEICDAGDDTEYGTDPEELLKKIDSDVVSIVKIETKRLIEEPVEQTEEENLESNVELVSAVSPGRNNFSEIVEDEVENYLIDQGDGMDFYETIVTEELEATLADIEENHEDSCIESSDIKVGISCSEASEAHKNDTFKGSNKSVCDECGAVFKNNSHMRRHVQRKHRKDSYKFECEICGSRFLLNFDLKRHMIKHSNIRNHECDLCEQKFKTELSLINHRKIVHNPHVNREKKFMCQLCERSYIHQRHLDYHMRKHTGDQRYGCDLCEKTFLYSDAVKWHKIRFHGEAAPFNCSVCGKKFIHEKSLFSHEKEHQAGSGSLAVECTICGKSISEKRHLQRHMRGHIEKQFQCSQCGEAFKERHQLSKHSLSCIKESANEVAHFP